jgi:hypothetical protein
MNAAENRIKRALCLVSGVLAVALAYVVGYQTIRAGRDLVMSAVDDAAYAGERAVEPVSALAINNSSVQTALIGASILLAVLAIFWSVQLYLRGERSHYAAGGFIAALVALGWLAKMAIVGA